MDNKKDPNDWKEWLVQIVAGVISGLIVELISKLFS